VYRPLLPNVRCGAYVVTLWYHRDMAKQTRRARAQSHKKDTWIRFRVSDAQKTTMEVAANDVGLSLSAWLRQLALKAARDTGMGR
jgi:hypothetical protein